MCDALSTDWHTIDSQVMLTFAIIDYLLPGSNNVLLQRLSFLQKIQGRKKPSCLCKAAKLLLYFRKNVKVDFRVPIFE